MERKSGFTLVEIMIVVAIVGLLASLATLAVSRSRRKAYEKQAESELAMLSASILQLAWDTGKWPNGAWRNKSGSTEIWNLSTMAAGLVDMRNTNGFYYTDWKGPYYEGSMLDPWGKPYFFDPDYLKNGTNRIVVGSFGPNGVGKNVYDKDDIVVFLDD